MGALNEWKAGAGGGTPFAIETMNEPFWVKTANYNGGTGNIDVTVGRGRQEFAGGVMVTLAGDTVVNVTWVANTTWYVFVNSAGSILVRTTPTTAQGGEIRVGSIASGANTGVAIVRTDLRSMLGATGMSLEDTAGNISSVGTVKVAGTSLKGAHADHGHDANFGHGSGNIPISDGTVNTNLNADMVDGYHAGHASGQVAVADGTLVTNLNADLVDGLRNGQFDAATLGTWSLATVRANSTGGNADTLGGLGSGSFWQNGGDKQSYGRIFLPTWNGNSAWDTGVNGQAVVGWNFQARQIFTGNTRDDTKALDGDILINA